jgi:ketosteroid isomerase-like protein
LAIYENGLNESDVESVMKIYASDGVLMEQYSRASVGQVKIRKAYQAMFKLFSLNVVFKTDEIKQIAPDWIFARSHSVGTVKINATGKKGPAIANQELWIFQKINGLWKIAQYCFTTTNPPPKVK